jgi:hypothetical protein
VFLFHQHKLILFYPLSSAVIASQPSKALVPPTLIPRQSSFSYG